MAVFRIISCLLIFAFLFCGCKTTEEITSSTLFSFTYEDEEYQIVSIRDSEGTGANLLLKKEGITTVYRARDYNQDGRLDMIQSGKVDLSEANIVYEYGLHQAVEEGKLRTQYTKRIYEYTDSNSMYTIETYGFFRETLKNQFIIRDLFNNYQQEFLDLDADGKLDRSEHSSIKITEAQLLYELVLKKGVAEKKIDWVFSKYIVILDNTRSAS